MKGLRLLLTIAVLPVASASADDVEAILAATIADYDANSDRLRTWQASAVLHSAYPARPSPEAASVPGLEELFREDSVLRKTMSRARFELDFESNSLRSWFEGTGTETRVGQRTGRSIEFPQQVVFRWGMVITPEHALSLDATLRSHARHQEFPDSPAPDEGYLVIRREALDEKGRPPRGTYLDPRSHLRLFGSEIARGLESKLKAVRDGVYEMQLDEGDDGTKILRWKPADVAHAATIKIQNGRSLLVGALAEFPDGGKMAFEWGYEFFGDIFVLSRFHEVQTKPSGDLALDQEIEFTDQLVNEPIDPERFTVESFDLKDGDRLVDSIAETKAVVWDGEWIAPSEYADIVTRPAGPDVPRLGYWIILAGLILIAAGIVRSRLRRTA